MGSFTNDVTLDKAASTVSVSLELAWTPFFAHFLDAKITPIRVDATARFVGSTNLCVLTLDPAQPIALHLDKSARLNAQACSVYSNSTHSEGIRLDSDSSIAADLVCSAGGVKSKTNAITPQPTTDCPAVPDPLANRPAPKFGGCDYENVDLEDVTKTLSPGVYCGGIELSGASQVSFNPGIYIIKDGKFEISGSAQIIGSNVGFYLTGANATLNFTGNTTVKLSGPETGPMAGLLFFEDRTSKIGNQNRINSAHANVLTGTIYLPRSSLLIDPNASVAAESAYTAIITYQLQLNEGPQLVLNSDYGATAVPVPAGIKSSGHIVLTD